MWIRSVCKNFLVRVVHLTVKGPRRLLFAPPLDVAATPDHDLNPIAERSIGMISETATAIRLETRCTGTTLLVRLVVEEVVLPAA